MKRITRLFTALLLFICACPSVQAQMDPSMPMVPANDIDGSQHPEQIPDAVMLRLWLGAYIPGGQIRDISHLRLSLVDSTAMQDIMASYYAQLAPLAKTYNDTAVFAMNIELRSDDTRQNRAPVDDHSRCGFVARGFDPQDVGSIFRFTHNFQPETSC